MVQELRLFLADADECVLVEPTLRQPPYSAGFNLRDDAAYAGLTIVYANDVSRCGRPRYADAHDEASSYRAPHD